MNNPNATAAYKRPVESLPVSECCSVEMQGPALDHGICPDCREHTEAVYDEEIQDSDLHFGPEVKQGVTR